MSRFTEVMDGFVQDENGKFHIRPMKLPDYMTANLPGQNNEKKRTIVRRKYIHIEPLGPLEDFFKSYEDGKTPTVQAKKRKVEEKQIRKELFKPPEKKPVRKLMSYGTRRPSLPRNCTPSTKSQSSSNTKKAKTQVLFDGSPLIDVDEAEKLLSKNKLITKSVKTALFPITEAKDVTEDIPNNNTPMKLSFGEKDTTPTSSESREFLELEQALASCKKSRKSGVSPLTSICTLMENTTIKSSENNLEKNNIKDILLLVKEDQQQWNRLNHQWNTLNQEFLRYQEEHDHKMNKITELLEQVVENKENVNRKSLRIAAQTIKTQFVVSPALQQKVDLRKSTLNKNLSKNLEADSPRTRNAVKMYNNIRNDYSMLCTPKIDRMNADVSHASATRSLSRRIQNQCLLLQDTPKPRS